MQLNWHARRASRDGASTEATENQEKNDTIANTGVWSNGSPGSTQQAPTGRARGSATSRILR